MTDNEVLDVVYKFTNPVLLAIVGYFLRNILATIKKLQEDFNKFQIENAGQHIIMQEHRERLKKIEDKLENYDRDFKLFYMEYGPVLKKAKRESES
jgi:archaellum component FlaC